MPLNSSGSSSSVGARRGGSSNLLVMVGLVAVVMFMAIFSIHSSFSWHEMDEKATASVVTKTSHEDFKRLMDQTKQLLNDMAAANSTLTLDTLRDFKALTLEEKRMGEQNEALEREVDRLETALTHCLKGKYDAETSLDTCKREFKDYQVVYNKDTASAATKTVKCPDVPVNVEPPQPPPAAVDETKWLVIGIPTVARRNDLDYLLKTLAAMVDQLPLDRDDPLYRRVLVHVINMQVNSDPHHRHVVFDQAKGLYGPGSGSPYAPYFKFSELLASEVEADPVPGRTPQNDPGTPNLPGFLVRRQTRNIAYVMQRSLRLAKFYLFLEDDMMLCPQGFHAIEYLLRKASRYHPHWLAIRASYGMNGIFMHDEDLATFAAYLLKHQKRRPPDHLVVEWYAGETPEAAAHKRQRKNVGFKFNLFDHLGVISTLRSQQQTSFPRCYDLLIEPTVFQVEAYSPVDCPRDDVWPCANTQQPPERVLIDWAKVTR